MNSLALLLSSLLMQGSAPDEELWDALRARIEASSQDIAMFIERRTGCNHFWGEVGSGHPGREQQVQDALKELRCDDLETDEQALRRALQDKREVLKLLDDTKELMPW